MGQLVFKQPFKLVFQNRQGVTVEAGIATLEELQFVRVALEKGDLKNLPDTTLELQLWLATVQMLGLLVEV